MNIFTWSVIKIDIAPFRPSIIIMKVTANSQQARDSKMTFVQGWHISISQYGQSGTSAKISAGIGITDGLESCITDYNCDLPRQVESF